MLEAMKQTEDSRSSAGSIKENSSTGIQSIEVGMPLLAALAKASRPLTLSELARETGMAASKAHKYLASFARSGAVEQNQHSGLYDLGPLALRLGLSALRRIDVNEIALGAMVKLRDCLNQTITLTSWMPLGPTIVRIVESSRLVNITLRPGSILPVLSSSSGPLFAAYLDSSQTRALIEQELQSASKALAKLKLSTYKDVDSFLDNIRKRGIAQSNETVLPGVTGLSAPVFNHEGIVATLSVVAVKADVDLSLRGDAARALMSHARAVSSRLGADSGAYAAVVAKLDQS